jgi:uncharacterized protein YabN with tetrapyrrole methylase and pyrophosphatase domain
LICSQLRSTSAEGRARGKPAPAAALAGVPEGLPALLRAHRLGEKAARSHCEDASLAAALARVRQEFAVLEEQVGALAAAPEAGDLSDEVRARLGSDLGELLFGLCQLARRLGLNAEESLRACTRRFVDRFRRMEQQAGRPLAELGREELVSLWQQAKESVTKG